MVGEQLILGAIILHPDAAFVEARAVGLSDRDFSDPRHREAYRALVALHAAGTEIGLTTLKEQLGIPFEDRERAAFISGLIDGIPRVTNIRPIVGFLREIRFREEVTDMEGEHEGATESDAPPPPAPSAQGDGDSGEDAAAEDKAPATADDTRG